MYIMRSKNSINVWKSLTRVCARASEDCIICIYYIIYYNNDNFIIYIIYFVYVRSHIKWRLLKTISLGIESRGQYFIFVLSLKNVIRSLDNREYTYIIL